MTRVEADDYAAGIEVVVQGLAFAEELRGKKDVRHHHLETAVGKALAVRELLAGGLGIADRNR